MKKFVFATNNAHKLEEVKDILGNKIEVLSMADINCHADIPLRSAVGADALLDGQQHIQYHSAASPTAQRERAVRGASQRRQIKPGRANRNSTLRKREEVNVRQREAPGAEGKDHQNAGHHV